VAAATWALLPQLVRNQQCRQYWQQHYLYGHLDNHGVKNTAELVKSFNASCQDTAYRGKVNRLYEKEFAGRRGHLVRPYKTVGAQSLDLHLFGAAPGRQRAAEAGHRVLHGGSWSEGKPDWFFGGCEDFAKRGWVACAVEYRTLSRHNTLPFAAVRDARSALRWLRQHATELGLDTARIVATGNSAGGHLAVATALATGQDEATDDRRYSPRPNAVVANAGVYDLTTPANAWIAKDLKDKAQVRRISPVHLVRPALPPMLLLHGTEDGNVPIATAEAFRTAAAAAGNRVELESLPGAGHFIWFDRRFGKQVWDRRNAYLLQLGFVDH
jgi:acetyl esterase/lipase